MPTLTGSADLATALRDRAIGALILVFALPNTIPMPPGVSSVESVRGSCPGRI